MKNIRKYLISCICLLIILFSTGCSCAKPISVKYKINVEGDAAPLISVDVVMYEKFRESMDTPCYKKMTKGYVKLEEAWEIQQCIDSECYKKVGKEYVLITNNLDIVKCVDSNETCYENVKEDYYKLIENPEGISECYTESGEKFERATYSKKEKEKLSTITAVNNNDETFSYESEYEKLPTTETYSYLYEFIIKNKGEQNVKINKITYEQIVKDSLVDESKNKVVVKTSTNEDPVLGKDGTYTITVEVKFLSKNDIKSEVAKDLELNIPVIANLVTQ